MHVIKKPKISSFSGNFILIQPYLLYVQEESQLKIGKCEDLSEIFVFKR